MKNLLKEMSSSELLSEKNKQVMNTKIDKESRNKRIELIEIFEREVKSNEQK